MTASPMTLNDIYPGGTLLQQVYRKHSHSLYLWHFAYREGRRIELAKVSSHTALEMANDYWGRALILDKLPTPIVDTNGNKWERKWYPMTVEAISENETGD